MSNVTTYAEGPITEADRETFVAAHQHLDLTETPDAWGRPMFKHSHIQALWDGWSRGRAALRKHITFAMIGNERK